MSEARLLSLVARYPHRSALARHVRDGSAFAALSRLEARGLVTRQRERYRLTRRGKVELAMTRALARLIARTYFTKLH
jgi:Mn-dependent DtxR family transcriptional regulator